MPATPETTPYLLFGLGVVFSVMGVFIATLITRSARLRRDLNRLRALAEDERRAP
jgi:hypothetical protein